MWYNPKKESIVPFIFTGRMFYYRSSPKASWSCYCCKEFPGVILSITLYNFSSGGPICKKVNDMQILKLLKLMFLGAWLIRRIWGFRHDIYWGSMCMSEINLMANRYQFILRSEKTRKDIKTSSLTPQNGLCLRVVGRIIAFLAMFLEEMRLMWLYCPVPNVMEG